MVTNEEITIAVWSTLGTALCTLIFGVAVLFPAYEMTAYASSLGIALCYLTLTVTNERFAVFASASSSRLVVVYARLATTFATVYCTLVGLVYYTQLTFVRLGHPGPEALSIVSYTHAGSAFFAIDIFGCHVIVGVLPRPDHPGRQVSAEAPDGIGRLGCHVHRRPTLAVFLRVQQGGLGCGRSRGAGIVGHRLLSRHGSLGQTLFSLPRVQ